MIIELRGLFLLCIDHNSFSWLIFFITFIYFLPSPHTCNMSSSPHYQLVIYFSFLLKKIEEIRKTFQELQPHLSRYLQPNSWGQHCILDTMNKHSNPFTQVNFHSVPSNLFSHSRIILQQFLHLSPASSFFPPRLFQLACKYDFMLLPL